MADPLALWLSQDHRDRLDAAGRPLGEVASRLYPPGTREVACPYPGSRAGKPMNPAALAQYRRASATCLATLAPPPGTSPTAAAVLALCARVLAAPLSLEGPVPVALAALYKTSVGLHQMLVSLLLDDGELAARPARAIGDGEAFHRIVEDGGWLVGQRQVCAAAPADIARTWDVLTGRVAAPDAAPLALPPVGAWAAAATGLVVALVVATQRRILAGDRADLAGFGGDPKVERWPLGARLWREKRAPWIIAATARHDREPEAALRLFEAPPPAVSLFVEGYRTAPDHAALEGMFHASAAQLPAVRSGQPS